MTLSRALPTPRSRSSNTSQRRNDRFRSRSARRRIHHSSSRDEFRIKMEEDSDCDDCVIAIGSGIDMVNSNTTRHRRNTKTHVHKRSNNNQKFHRGRVKNNRNRNRNRRKASKNATSSSNSKQSSNTSMNITAAAATTTLKPIHVSSSSIHTNWKKELGGIIRYFVHTISSRGIRNEHEVMKELESLYFENGCDVKQTKNAMMAYLGAVIPKNKDDENNNNKNSNKFEKEEWKWVDIQMAIEKCDENNAQETSMNNSDDTTTTTRPMMSSSLSPSTKQPINDEINQSFCISEDNKGILLKNEIHQGEGPAHSFERWTNIIIPQWAIGKSYFFQINNKSPLDLSCEMTIDDHKVAKNVPIPSLSSRMIRPDHLRYFEMHKWILQPAQKVKLHEAMMILQSRNLTSEQDEGNDNITSGQSNSEGLKDDSKYRSAIHLEYPDPKNRPFDDDDDDDDDNDDDKTGGDEQRDNNIGTGQDGDINMTGSNDGNGEGNKIPQYARNDDYDFDNEGHDNRATAMTELEKTRAYAAWEDAARKEWACIHAKFYVSLPKRSRKYRNENGQRGKSKVDQQELPQQAPIIDVKAAERATLGTKFHAVGPSLTNKRSNVVMKRINGLNDSDEYRAPPVFEYKLYYRAEQEVSKNDGYDSDDDETGCNDEQKEVQSRGSLPEYKQKMVHKVTKVHQTTKFHDQEEADFVIENRISFINAAETHDKVDSIVTEYDNYCKKSHFNYNLFLNKHD